MDWKSHRIEALLEHALIEDKAASDATTNLTIDPNLRASASIMARQEMVVAGLGCVAQFLEIFARLDAPPQSHNRFEVISHPEIFDGVRVHPGQVLAVVAPQRARAAELRARDPEPDAAHERDRHPDTRTYVDAIQGTHARILDTRKTVPGLSALENMRCCAEAEPITGSTWPAES